MYGHFEKTISLSELLEIKSINKVIEKPEEIKQRDEIIELYKEIYSSMLKNGYSSRKIFETISDEFNNYVLSKDTDGTKKEISLLEKKFNLFLKYKALIESSKELECFDKSVKEQIDNIKSKSIKDYR